MNQPLRYDSQLTAMLTVKGLQLPKQSALSSKSLWGLTDLRPGKEHKCVGPNRWHLHKVDGQVNIDRPSNPARFLRRFNSTQIVWVVGWRVNVFSPPQCEQPGLWNQGSTIEQEHQWLSRWVPSPAGTIVSCWRSRQCVKSLRRPIWQHVWYLGPLSSGFP